MENILLIEPNYICKYPPLGLMKIAYYHKEKRNDFVWFAKGELPYKITDKIATKLLNSKYYQDRYGNNICSYIDEVNKIISAKNWDRIYISTLFTYEWDKTLKAVEYAKTLVNDISKIYVGGILATLLSDEFERETGIKPIRGQLYDSSLLGYDDCLNIDELTPDYSILDNTEYNYPASNAYYTYATRGCGMNCQFCAVKTLEPKYINYIPIKEQINEINRKYGEKKDLLLMDNNVLKSNMFRQIIDDIIDLGFGKGATFINPRTGKQNSRYVDFNQGLDMLLFTEDKVKLLSKIAIKPARIAFDHIEDEKRYVKALKLAVKYDITNLSNYILYNGTDFTGKGKMYKADSPQDLYNRLKINVDCQEVFNEKRKKEGKDLIHIFSFPMRYIPLDDKCRGYVGSNWNEKYLRAIQRILIPTQGKGVASKSFFNAAFGENAKTFMLTLLMPESYIATRGNPDKIKNISDSQKEKKKQEFILWESLRVEWKKLYNKLDKSQKDNFERIISKNEFDLHTFMKIKDTDIRKIFLHYFSDNGIINLISSLDVNIETKLKNEVIRYILEGCKAGKDGEECYPFLEKIARYIVKFNINDTQIGIIFKNFGKNIVKQIVDLWVKDGCNNDKAIEVLKNVDGYYVNIYYMYLIKWCKKLKIIDNDIINKMIVALCNKDDSTLSKVLDNKIDLIFYKIETNYSGSMNDKDFKNLLYELKLELSKQYTFL